MRPRVNDEAAGNRSTSSPSSFGSAVVAILVDRDGHMNVESRDEATRAHEQTAARQYPALLDGRGDGHSHHLVPQSARSCLAHPAVRVPDLTFGVGSEQRRGPFAQTAQMLRTEWTGLRFDTNRMLRTVLAGQPDKEDLRIEPSPDLCQRRLGQDLATDPEMWLPLPHELFDHVCHQTVLTSFERTAPGSLPARWNVILVNDSTRSSVAKASNGHTLASSITPTPFSWTPKPSGIAEPRRQGEGSGGETRTLNLGAKGRPGLVSSRHFAAQGRNSAGPSPIHRV